MRAASGDPEPIPSVRLDSAQSWSVLGLLTLTYALAFVDRQMLNLLVDPIKSSLRLSDTEFSLVQGSAFVIAYLLATPVFGRLVDVANRRNILVFAVCVWSLCTAACGLATSYWGLFVPRVGIGISEACVLPVAWSLIGDYFSSKRVPRALSIFQVGTQLGSGFSLIASGAVIAFAAVLAANIASLEMLAPWQMAFVVIGLPGILLAAVLLLAVREPRRQKVRSDKADHPPLAEVGKFMWQRRGLYARLYLAIGTSAMFQLGMAAWFPSFLIRMYEIPAAVTGYQYGLLSVVCGSTGVLAGPGLARWLLDRSIISTPLQMAGTAMLLTCTICVSLPYAPTANAALALAGAALFVGSLPLALISSAATLATPSRMRGVAGSMYTFSSQGLGYGVGPTAIALLTDRVFQDPKMVGFSLEIVAGCACAISATMLFTLALRQRRLGDEAAVEAPAT